MPNPDDDHTDSTVRLQPTLAAVHAAVPNLVQELTGTANEWLIQHIADALDSIELTPLSPAELVALFTAFADRHRVEYPPMDPEYPPD